MQQSGMSVVAAGSPGEPILAEWDRGRIHVVKRPDDEQGILRISVGGGIERVKLDYCVFRSDRTACAFLLEQAALALRETPEQDI